MTLVGILKELWRRRLLVLAAVLASALVAIVAVYQVSLSPLSVSKRSQAEARGSISVLIDSTRSPIADAQRELSPLVGRAAVFARFMAGGNVVARIAAANKIPVKQIEVAGPTPLPGQAPGLDEPSGLELPYAIAVSQQGELPIVTVDTRAPTMEMARSLAAAAPGAVSAVVRGVQRAQETPVQRRVQFRVLGPAQAGMVDESQGLKVAVSIFLVTFLLLLGAILAVPRLIAAWRDEGPGGKSQGGSGRRQLKPRRREKETAWSQGGP